MENCKYFFEVEKTLPRLLSQLDRNPLSSTYGCFDREFWMHKTKDFSSATFQMSTHALALLWASFPKSQVYKKDIVLDWISAGVEFLLSIQHRDGSYDEWYPNEKGWAGPTGYVLHSLCQTYQLISCHVDENLKLRIEKSILKSALFLGRRDEKDILANHFAIAILPLWEAYEVTKDKRVLGFYNFFLEQFKGFVSEEGWSLEYDGVDIGYNLATLSFFARLHQLTLDSYFLDYTEKSLRFLRNFCYPDGSFAGCIGSRHTNHFYPFATEYWKSYFSDALYMNSFFGNKWDRATVVDLQTQEDHYLPYRLSDYLEASLRAQDEKPKQLEIGFDHRDNFEKYYVEAGIFLKKTSHYFFVTNLKRGGCFKLFCLKDKKLIEENCGWLIEAKTNKKITSLVVGQDYSVSVDEKRGFIEIEGSLHKLPSPLFNPFKMIIFRSLLILFGWNSWGAYKIKCLIRKLLIVGKETSGIHFKRKIAVNKDEVQLFDELNLGQGDKVERVLYGGGFSARYVPQSRYFTKNDLLTKSKTFSRAELANLNSSGKCELRSGWNF